MVFRSLSTALLLTVVATPSFGAGIYKWVDKNGKTHFGDRPPVDAAQPQEVRIRDIPQSEQRVPSDEERRSRRKLLLESFAEGRAEKEKTAARQKEERKKLAAQCVQAKQSLQQIRRSSHLYEVDESGNKVVHSDAERDEATRSLEKAIKKNCD